MARKVQPLRISKNTPSSTPQKMAPSNRALSEISATSMRRNSPSYNQATKKMIVTRETSPYTENSPTKTNTRDFWSSRDPLSPARLDVENSFTDSLRSPSPGADASPKRRPSVERLQQASRVKNSKIFELENKAAYDPSCVPVVERPAANRPTSHSFANNSFTRMDSLRKENNPVRTSPAKGHKRSETEISVPTLTPTKLSSPEGLTFSDRAASPATGSPTKSSLSRTSQFSLHSAMMDNSLTWSDEDRCSTPRALHRQNKSVTFETEPPLIQEYDNPTPEPSNDSRDNSLEENEYYDEDDSFDRGSSADIDDSFESDLENTEKTPVDLPWSGINPEELRRNLIDDEDDVFESSVLHTRPDNEFRRSVSVASDGSSRPLPPLPSTMRHQLRKKESHRQLLHIERAESEELIVRNLDTGEVKELHVSINEGEVQDESVVAELEEFAQSPRRISRESILAKVRGSKYDFDDETEDETFADATENAHPSYAELALYDPDQPVQSREISHEDTLHAEIVEPATIETAVEIKIEEEAVVELSSIPVTPAVETLPSFQLERDSSVVRNISASPSEDEESRYSPTESEINQAQVPEIAPTLHAGESLDDAMSLLTVKDYSDKKSLSSGDLLGLPQYDGEDWGLGMQDYCTPSPPVAQLAPEATPVNAFMEAPIIMPEVSLAASERVGTPDSVIRRTSDAVSDITVSAMPNAPEVAQHVEEQQYDGVHRPVSPVIPERKATIKTGGKLKARPSGTPADFQSLFAGEVDLDQNPMPDTKHASQLDLSLDMPDFVKQDAEQDTGDMLGLDQAFDRVIQNQTKGYLTRQNTKVVVASTRNVSGESNGIAPTPAPSQAKTSPRKPSTEQHFKAEPWNGKQRRKSLRTASAQQGNNGPAPPLPGQQSALGVVTEDRSLLDGTDAGEIERGRLFIKVVGVQELDLPLPKNDRLDFKLTLDNGLHCVTTGALELGHSASIGQEFELVVQNDLEFQLTLSTRLPAPVKPVEEPLTAPSSPTKSSKSTFAKFLSSPKKRAEKERQERELQEAEERRRREEIVRKRASVRPNAFEMMRELVNSSDGSFARAYVNLSEHEEGCFGRKLEVDVPLYNEWALEKDDAVVSSVRSKRGANWGPVRRPPYIIGQLKCQLLYVPKPKDASDEDMPKSMSSAVREMNKASDVVDVAHEGFLSQQGGDCVHWRRRFFSVVGSKLTAYHEHTHQKRAVINLAKASRLVDDKSTLVADHTAGSKARSGRRKSAFAEEDEGYQYVEEGFRIRFANGETIDFYADSRAEKDAWMTTLAQVIGKPDQSARKAKWTDLVLAHEKTHGVSAAAKPEATLTSTTEVRDFVDAPPPPSKESVRKPVPTSTSPLKRPESLPMAQSPAKRPSTPPMQPRAGHRKRDAVKSMIF
ncbi:hypothetical protein AMS68_006815 [Peltaster fructicola]|uniref:PH domain-containing protein n=1 Tax=Peltaster fructicola TaxID=286661 RepID=A0A6H0Y374_9PEZI|nr:hypothetical protein AMS68_006815 [Peltaster fructicola]